MKKTRLLLLLLLPGALLFYHYNHFAVIRLQTGEFKVYRIELADTPERRAEGLMFRPSLAENAGMLFIYPDADIRRFWMMNTFVPLDITFFDASGRVINYHSASLCRKPPCKIYASETATRLALETHQGHARRFERLVFYH